MDKKTKFVINALFYGIILLLLYLFYKYILPILTPFIIGFCVASLVHFILRKLRIVGMKHEKIAAPALCVGIYAAISGILFLLGATIVAEIRDFAAAMPDLFDNQLSPFFEQCYRDLEGFLAPIDPTLLEWILEIGKSLAAALGELATNLSASLVRWVASSAIELPGLVIEIVLTIVSTFYIAGDYDRVLNFLKSLIPGDKREMTVQTLHYAETAVLAFVRSYSILFILTFAELSIGLLILNIPYAVAIAAAISLFDLMPVLGTGGILLPWVVILVVMGDYPLAIGILILYIIVTVVRNIVEPRIVGNRIGLHPLATLVAMIVGLDLMGLLGMLLLPIALVAITNLHENHTSDTE